MRAAVSIPLAVKLSPFFTALANFALRVDEAGADGLVLFNRFYQPDLDLETRSVTPRLVLSSSEELRLPLRWIAILFGRVRTSLAATTGVHTGLDAAKVLLAGANVATMTSALPRNGPEHDHDSVAQLRGSMSHAHMPDPAGFERANYVRTCCRGPAGPRSAPARRPPGRRLTAHGSRRAARPSR